MGEAKRIKWDVDGEHLYETGVSCGILFPMGSDGSYEEGVAWNGLTGITESPSGAEATAIYADNIKYLNLYSAEEFGGTIEAYMYPDEFMECDGSAEASDLPGAVLGQQGRKSFALCYRTEMGNDLQGEKYGYKIHILYGLRASPSEKAYQTINDSPEAITFSWEVTSTPTSDVPAGMKPTSTLVFDSTVLTENQMKALEDKLYGKDPTTDPVAEGVAPALASPKDLINLIKAVVEPTPGPGST